MKDAVSSPLDALEWAYAHSFEDVTRVAHDEDEVRSAEMAVAVGWPSARKRPCLYCLDFLILYRGW